MKIFISGICGTGMGPLALMAHDAGFDVVGSDMNSNEKMINEFSSRGIKVSIGQQDGSFLKEQSGIDWYIHTSAMNEEHPEVLVAKEMGLKISKRDELIAFLIQKLNLKMIAVAGTHGKTTTTAMIIYALYKLKIPAAHLVGSTLSFAPAGAYKTGDRYFVYEADEYDRNFLAYYPQVAVLPSVTYDHPDTYPTREDYVAAFEQFKSQSEVVIEDRTVDPRITLVGEARRIDASMAMRAILAVEPGIDVNALVAALNDFPGAGRRFERVANHVYSDYGHHPEEIEATINMAHEEAMRLGLNGVVAIYKPHQNLRQYAVRHEYKNSFLKATKVFWLPTFLSREDPAYPVLTPADLIQELTNPEIAEPAEQDENLAQKILAYHNDGYLIIFISACKSDEWIRNLFAS